MRELKSDSPSIQPAQADGDRSLADAATEAVQEVASTRKRQPVASKPAASKTKSTAKAKQGTSTSVKQTWELNQPSIVVRFQRLEQELQQLKTQANQINQQSIAIQSEMQELRTIAHTAHPSRSPESTMQRSPIQSSHLDIPPFLLERRSSKPEPAASLPGTAKIASASRQDAPIVPQPTPSDTPPKFLASPRPKGSVAPRRRTLRYYWRQLQPRLHLPQTQGAIAIDAVLWTFAAIGLRMGLKLLEGQMPFLGLPISLLLLVPAGLAGYLAFCVAKSSPVLIYRLLLITLGLLIGGKV